MSPDVGAAHRETRLGARLADALDSPRDNAASERILSESFWKERSARAAAEVIPLLTPAR